MESFHLLIARSQMSLFMLIQSVGSPGPLHKHQQSDEFCRCLIIALHIILESSWPNDNLQMGSIYVDPLFVQRFSLRTFNEEIMFLGGTVFEETAYVFVYMEMNMNTYVRA